MITEEELAKEFRDLVNRYYPKTGQILQRCCVKVITTHWGRPLRRVQYVGIYCPEEVIDLVSIELDALRDIAENMGLEQVICRNANRLLRDPLSKIKQTEPRFWLELHWTISRDES